MAYFTVLSEDEIINGGAVAVVNTDFEKFLYGNIKIHIILRIVLRLV